MEKILDNSYGVVPVFKTEPGELLFCVVQHAGEHYGFPKGHGDPGESEEETALRELREEASIVDVNIIQDISFSQRYSFEKDGVVYDKTVKYFLGFVPTTEASIPKEFEHEISAILWKPAQETRELVKFPETQKMFDEIFAYLKKH